MAAKILIREDQNSVSRLTLNRPEARNALSQGMIDELQNQLDQIAENPAISVVVIAANGPAFCAGHDLREMRDSSDNGYFAKLMASCSRLMLRVQKMPQPIIAQVHGIATAAGCQLVASCDLAIATESTSFVTPGVNIGLFCHTPAVALARAIGKKQAMEMLLTGELMDAHSAKQAGLINRVVQEDQLEKAVDELANKIASKSASVIAQGKAVFYRQIEEPVEVAYHTAAQAMVDNLAHPDAKEGIAAFLEKRAPRWEPPTS